MSVLQFYIASLPRAVQQPINNPPIDEQGRNSRGAWLSRGELVKGNLGVVEGRTKERQMGTKDRREGNPTRREARGFPRVKEDDPWMSSFVWGQTNTSWGNYHRRRRGERGTEEP